MFIVIYLNKSSDCLLFSGFSLLNVPVFSLDQILYDYTRK